MPDVAIVQTSIEQATVAVTEVDQVRIVEVSVGGSPVIVETGVVGPQGPQGPSGPAGAAGSSTLASLTDVDSTVVVNRSTLVYDATAGKWKANPNTTVDEILNGGNF